MPTPKELDSSKKFASTDPANNKESQGCDRAFYLTRQLAERWAISERQVHRLIACGDLVPTRICRSVRISADEVARFEAACTAVK